MDQTLDLHKCCRWPRWAHPAVKSMIITSDCMALCSTTSIIFSNINSAGVIRRWPGTYATWLKASDQIHIILMPLSALPNASGHVVKKQLLLNPPYFVTQNACFTKAQSSPHCRRRRLGGRAWASVAVPLPPTLIRCCISKSERETLHTRCF